MRTEEEARAAVDAGADAVAFVFDPQAADHVAPDEAYAIMATLPPYVASVGVFRDPTLDEFSQIEQTCPTSLTQFEGAEAEKLVRQCGPGLIRGVAYDPGTIVQDLVAWDAMDEVDAILVDVGGAALPPGLPEALDRIDKPIILAAAFTPETLGRAVRTLRPYGVQLAFGDGPTLGALFRAVRDGDHQA